MNAGLRQKISQRSSRIDASGIRKVFDLAANLKSPVDLSIGQPDFDTPEDIQQAAIQAIRSGRNRYTVTQGIEPLRRKLKEKLGRDKGVSGGEILITSGTSGGLLLAFMAVVNPGDEVLLPDPYFVIYKSLTRLMDAVPVCIPTYPDFRLREDAIRPLISPRTKLIVINSPGNPTGVVYQASELDMVARLARQHDFLVLSDEIYDTFVYDQDATPTIARQSENTILLGGFSKTYSIPGWRMGYAWGPAEIISEMTKLQQYTFVCAPSFAQHALLDVLDSLSNDQVDNYRRKRDIIYEGLRDLYEVEKPGGAFYIFPKTPWGTDVEFVEAAIRENLLIIPGNVFSEQATHFRISFAAADETLRKGVEILRRLARPRRSTVSA